MKYLRIDDQGFLGAGTRDCIGPIPDVDLPEQTRQLRSLLCAWGRYRANIRVLDAVPDNGRNHWTTVNEYKKA